MVGNSSFLSKSYFSMYVCKKHAFSCPKFQMSNETAKIEANETGLCRAPYDSAYPYVRGVFGKFAESGIIKHKIAVQIFSFFNVIPSKSNALLPTMFQSLYAIGICTFVEVCKIGVYLSDDLFIGGKSLPSQELL